MPSALAAQAASCRCVHLSSSSASAISQPSGWLCAGLYASPYSATPTEVSAATGRTATVRGRQLRIGAGHYSLSQKSLQAACRWLDRQGVTVRDHTLKETA